MIRVAFSFLVFLTVLAFRVDASSSATVIGTTKVNICGNNVVETPAEDCEGSDLNGASCESLGYASGTLSCDISCDFDESGCVAFTPTPTPTATSTPTATPTPTSTPTSTSTPTPTPTPTSSPTTSELISKVFEVLSFPIVVVNKLPSSLINLLKESGVEGNEINKENLVDIIKYFLKIKQKDPKTCDLNNNLLCDSVDLSIIFYYVKK